MAGLPLKDGRIKMRKDFFEWTNPLWNWIVSFLLLAIATYIMYAVGYAILRFDYISTIFGILYSAVLGWNVCIFSFRALYFSRNQNERN